MSDSNEKLQHTQGPWLVAVPYSGLTQKYYNILGPNAETVAVGLTISDAEYVVRACNDYDALRAKLAVIDAQNNKGTGIIIELTCELDTVRAELEAAKKRVAELDKANVNLADECERMKQGLRFYARGYHFSGDEGAWEDVSGEPPNWLCDEHGSTVEDGGIAKSVLLGQSIKWTEKDMFDNDDAWPPPELPEELAAMKEQKP